MSTSRRTGPDVMSMPGADHAEPEVRQISEGHPDAQHGSRPPGQGAGRKRRRRQRPQRGKQLRPMQGRAPRVDLVSREHVFQDLEGLLRQIREQAEESSGWPQEQLSEITQTVTSFTKSLEEQLDPISDRVRSEYQRIREKLSHALKGN